MQYMQHFVMVNGSLTASTVIEVAEAAALRYVSLQSTHQQQQ